MLSDDRIGRLIANRYQPLELIGAGSMGKVYCARDVRLVKTVALKFLNQKLQSPELCDRFQIEARVCAQLGSRSNYIVQVTDFGVDAEGVPFHAMEYLQGKSLRELLKHQPLPLAKFLNLSQQICLGLRCAHQGIQLSDNDPFYPVIHCDIKPSNVLVLPDDMLRDLVRILDFGVARLMQTEGVSNTFFNGGTLPYCSPEQLAGEALDPRSDIYSLGIMMFEMLTRKLPVCPIRSDFAAWFKAHYSQTPRTFEAVAPDLKVPKNLKQLVMACLEKRPADRPQTVGEVLGELRSLSDNSLFIQNSERDRAASIPQAAEPIEIPQVSMDATRQAHNLPVWSQVECQQAILYKLPTTNESLPALWVKLSYQSIQTIQIYGLYNKIHQVYLYPPLPHFPVMMWAAGIQIPDRTFHWFTCFLNLKTALGLQMVRSLAQIQQYQVLFFDLESPHWFSHQIKIAISSARCSEIGRYGVDSLSRPKTSTLQSSIDLLKIQFEQVRREIERIA